MKLFGLLPIMLLMLLLSITAVTAQTNSLSILPSGSTQIYISFPDASGKLARVPIAYASDGVKLGDNDDDLITDKTKTISRNDYFILSSEGKSYAMRYISAVASTESNPTIELMDVGSGSRVDVSYSSQPGEPGIGAPDAVINIDSTKFNVWNASDDVKSNFNLRIDLSDRGANDVTIHSADGRWDIQSFGSTQLYLVFTDALRKSARIPIAYATNGVKLGDIDDDLITDKTKTISRNDYFILSKDKRWQHALRYISALASGEANPALMFQNLGTGGRVDASYSAQPGEAGMGAPDAFISINGAKFNKVWNASADTSPNFDIRIDLDGLNTGELPPPAAAACLDSDGGKNYSKQGTVKYNLNFEEKYQYSLTDSCSGSTLNEYYCDTQSNAQTTYYTCPNGCKDGACMEAKQPPEQMYGGQILTLNEGGTKVYVLNKKIYETTLDFVGSISAKFTVNEEVTDTLAKGQTYTLKDGARIAVSDLITQDFAGRAKQAKFYFTEPSPLSEQPPTPAQPIPGEPPEFPRENIAEIKLVRGWNLISLPGELEKFLPSECAANKKLIGFVYIQEEGRYANMAEAQKALGSDLGKYLAAHSFWVYSYSECSLKAAIQDTPTETSEISLAKWWNLVPVRQSFTNKTLADVSGDCKIDSAYTWSAASQKWETLEPLRPFGQEGVNLGVAVKVGSACKLKA